MKTIRSMIAALLIFGLAACGQETTDIAERTRVDSNVFSTGEVYPNEVGKTAIVSKPAAYGQMFIDSCTSTNNSGSAIDLGCARLLNNDDWTFWALDDSATPDATDDTTDAQDAGAGDIVLFTTTNNDGWMWCGNFRPTAIGLTVSQAQTGSPVYAYSYYNGTDYSSTITPIQAISSYTAADHVLAFPMPADWEKGSTVAVGGPADDDQYCLRAIATTAPSQQVEGTIAWALRHEKYQQAIEDKNALGLTWQPPLLLGKGEGFLCTFSTASANNSCVINWRVK